MRLRPAPQERGPRAARIRRRRSRPPRRRGGVLFGDPDARFAGLLELLLDAVARLRGPSPAPGNAPSG